MADSAAAKKGTVTPLGSLIRPEEAQKASKRVHDAIADLRTKADRVNAFIADNSTVTKLVRQLPDEVSHDVMVPFGSSAFFPGRLIHTNEFLVLLGDGYYAERTAKQTVGILKRREKSLESQMEALKASLLDLEAEARFFDSTAMEAQEGLVEIREEYIEELENESQSDVPDSDFVNPVGNTSKLPNEDDEYSRIMAKLDELEKKELEAGSASDNDEDEDAEAESASGSEEDANAEDANAEASLDISEDAEAESASGSEEDENAEAYLDISASQSSANDVKGKSPQFPLQESRHTEMLQSAKPVGGILHQHLADQYSMPKANSKSLAKEGSAKSNKDLSRVTQKQALHHGLNENVQNFSDRKLVDSSDNISQDSTGFSHHRDFTGAVIEHTHGLPSNQPPRSSTQDQPSKPVSRFKMNRSR